MRTSPNLFTPTQALWPVARRRRKSRETAVRTWPPPAARALSAIVWLLSLGCIPLDVVTPYKRSIVVSVTKLHSETSEPERLAVIIEGVTISEDAAGQSLGPCSETGGRSAAALDETGVAAVPIDYVAMCSGYTNLTCQSGPTDIMSASLIFTICGRNYTETIPLILQPGASSSGPQYMVTILSIDAPAYDPRWKSMN